MEEHAQLVDTSERRVASAASKLWHGRRACIWLIVSMASMAFALGGGVWYKHRLVPEASLLHATAQTTAAPEPPNDADEPPSDTNAGVFSTQLHVLLFESDQARPDAHGPSLTPNLERIAREGARFTRAYSSTPICTPARLALLTGRGPHRHGMRSYQAAIPPPRPNRLELVSTFAKHGYYTSVVGKNHYGLHAQSQSIEEGGTPAAFETHGYHDAKLYEGLLMYDRRSKAFVRTDHYGDFFARSCPGCDPLATQRLVGSGRALLNNHSAEPDGVWAPWRLMPGATPYNSNQAFAYPYEERLHPTHWTATMAVRSLDHWLSRRANGTEVRPIFLKTSFHRPHNPYDPPARWLRAFSARSTMPAATGGLSGWDAHYAQGNERLQSCTASSRVYCGSSCGYQAYCGRLADVELAQVRAHYRASLAFVDEQAGRVLDRMRTATREWRSTFVLYTSDHGDALGDHNLWRKGFAYEQVASIPFFLRWPEAWDTAHLPRGGTIEALVELRDVFPVRMHVRASARDHAFIVCACVCAFQLVLRLTLDSR